jgi:hypothetical protein
MRKVDNENLYILFLLQTFVFYYIIVFFLLTIFFVFTVLLFRCEFLGARFFYLHRVGIFDETYFCSYSPF